MSTYEADREDGLVGMAVFKLTTVKATPWRGEAEELWSNSYHFSGTTPGTATDWTTLATAVFLSEGKFMYIGSPRTHLVHAYGYNPGSDIANYSGDFTAGGTATGIAPVGGASSIYEGPEQPLQICALLRWECGISAHTGKPRYLIKYIHDVPGNGSNPDSIGTIDSTGTAALASFTNGTLPDGAVLCAPDGTIASPGIIKPYYTTHQIKRRGKRPRRGA
jgi:hypothetical protein